MIYLLDTNACINYLNTRESPIKRRLVTQAASDIVLCSVVKAELFRGAYRSSQSQHNLVLIEQLSRQFASLSFDDRAADVYGRIRAQLEAIGMLIGPYDMMIAAIALVHHLTLVTHNTREFGRVAGLLIEDWEATA